MAAFLEIAGTYLKQLILLAPILVLISAIGKVFYNLYLHPLAKYPGPRLAAATGYRRAYKECIEQVSNVHELEELHATYGPIVRITPNELHFASPSAYNDIYNNKNRWDKEESLYHSFNEDESSFGYLHYSQAKERRDILLRMFSPKAIELVQNVVRDKVHKLCAAIVGQNEQGKSIDVFYAFRCATMDVLTYLCYGNSINALDEPDFKAPLVEAMHVVTPLSPMLQHFGLYKLMIQNCPPSIAIKLSPETTGLVRMQELLKKQIDHHIEDPSSLDHLPHSTTIFHVLLDPNAYRNKQTPSAKSLYQESQALMFGGVDTAASALYVGTFYLLKFPEVLRRLKEELKGIWPRLDEEPELKDLEKLEYLNAVIKEMNRIGPSIPGGLPRVVPAEGARIGGEDIPGGTVVSSASYFMHTNPEVFPNPTHFDPDRWLGPDASEAEKHFVSFSKGPRSCIGMNLGWCEMRICLANVVRRFDLELDPSGLQAESVPWRGVFSPHFPEPHLRVWMREVEK